MFNPANETMIAGRQTDPTSRVLRGLLLCALVAIGPWVVYRSCGVTGSDFPSFRAAGEFVAEQGTRHPKSALYRYLPSLDVACVPLTWIPIAVSAALWYALNAACWWRLLNWIRDDLLAGCERSFAEAVTLAAGLLGLPLAIDGFLLGGFHVLMLYLLLAGLSQAERGRYWSAGGLLGLATWLKLLPVCGIGYLAWRRQWKAVAVSVITVAVIDLALSLPAYGWHETCELHADWFWGHAVGTGDRQVAGETNDDEDRLTNQSLIVVLRRLLTDRGGFPQMSLAHLSTTEMTPVVLAVLLGLGASVWWILRTNARRTVPDRATEFALIGLCTVWLSPVVWSYHLVAAVPATAVVLARRPLAWQRWSVIAVWIAGLALFLVELGRAAGHMLWVTFALGGCLAWSITRVARPQYAMLTPVSASAAAPRAALPQHASAVVPATIEARENDSQQAEPVAIIDVPPSAGQSGGA